jgi:hypothetical protein
MTVKESFDWDEQTEQKRLVVTFPADSDVTEDKAREAIRALVDDDTDSDGGGPRKARDDSLRRFERGYVGGEE